MVVANIQKNDFTLKAEVEKGSITMEFIYGWVGPKLWVKTLKYGVHV